MKEMSVYMKTILQEKKITDYLAQKGIFPKREGSNRKMYICPIHEGDTSPSMVVYTNAEYENYYCYGCHSGSTIINLVADLEKIDKRQAFKILIRGLDIPGDAVLSDFSLDYDNFVKEAGYVDIISMSEVEELSCKISVECYNYLNLHTNFDEKEVDFFEKVLQKVDYLTRAKNKKSLEQIYYFLVEKGIPHRSKTFYEKKENRTIQEAAEMEVWSRF